MKANKKKTGTSYDKILKAALQEFSMKGIDGARVDEIVSISGVNKNMVYHHFESKEKLFVTVLETVYENVRKHQQDISLRDLDPITAMKTLVQHTADIWIEVPEFIRLLASENIHQAKHVRQSEKILSMYPPLIDNLREVLDRGVKDRVFRSGIDPVDLYISITSLSSHYVAHHHTFEAIFKRKLMTRKKLAERKERICEMVLRYLKP